MTTNCKIGKVRLKNGCEVLSFPDSAKNLRIFNFKWGEISIRTFDNKPLTNETLLYLMEVAKVEMMGFD